MVTWQNSPEEEKTWDLSLYRLRSHVFSSSDLAEQSRGRKDVGPEPIKPCPGDELFCEEADDYPTWVKLNDKVEAAKLVKDTIFDSKLSVRISDFYKESRACDHRKSTVYPKKAKNVEGAFVFIVNDEQYRQAVDIEQCLG